MPDEQSLNAYYNNQSYFHGNLEGNYTDYDLETERGVSLFNDFLLTIPNISEKKVLDIGCAFGTHLAIAAQHGCNAWGVELSGHARKIAMSRHGDNLQIVEKIGDLPRFEFDFILMLDVLEHLPNPQDIFIELFLSGVIGKHTQIFITTPNARSADAIIHPSNWLYRYPPAHLLYFSAYSLKLLLSNLGCVEIITQGIYPTSEQEIHSYTDEKNLFNQHFIHNAGLMCIAKGFDGFVYNYLTSFNKVDIEKIQQEICFFQKKTVKRSIAEKNKSNNSPKMFILKIYKTLIIIYSLRKNYYRSLFFNLLDEYWNTIVELRNPTQKKLTLPQSSTYSRDIFLKHNATTLLVIHEFSRTGAPYAVLYLAHAIFSLHSIKPIIISPKDGLMRQEFEQAGFYTLVDPLLFSYKDYSSEVCDFISRFERVIVTSLASFAFIHYFRGIAKQIHWWIHETEAGFTSISCVTDELPLLFSVCKSIWLGSPLSFPLALQYTSQNKLNLLLYGCPDTAIMERTHPIEKIIFSIIGTVEPRKGQDIFLDAIETLPPNLRSKAIFRIIGSACPYQESINFYKNLQARAEHMPEVELIENIPSDELQKFYANTDVIVSASRDDPMPIVVTQGLMFSKTCLCSSAIGHAQLLTNKKNGLIFTNESVDELAEQLTWIVNNPSEITRIGTTGRKIYEQYFLMNSFIDNLKKLI